MGGRGPRHELLPSPHNCSDLWFFWLFLVFSMVLLCFWEGPFGFFGFSGFPKGFATLACIVYTKHMVCMGLVYAIYAVHMM